MAALMRVSETVHRQYRRSTVAAGDILISVVGTIGRVAVVKSNCEGFNIARAIARVAPSDQVDSEFLASLLKAPSMQRGLVGNSFETARKTLNLSALATLELPVPDLKTQKAYTAEVARFLRVIDALSSKAQACSALIESAGNEIFQ